MTRKTPIVLTRKSQVLARDRNKRQVWNVVTKKARFAPDQTALLLCDVWDAHPFRGSAERLEAMVPRMNRLVKHLRRKGVLIIHAPSECMDYYKDHPARKSVLAVRPVKPKERKHADPPLPFPKESALSDTVDREIKMPPYLWKHENDGIEICDEDAISAEGKEIYSLMKVRGIKHLLFMGVHTNFCVLHRRFGIKQMTRWGVEVTLVRDLTDGIYSPAQPPYVSQAEATGLVVGYIEKFWCPSTESAELLK